jgi:hypothetical protein
MAEPGRQRRDLDRKIGSVPVAATVDARLCSANLSVALAASRLSHSVSAVPLSRSIRNTTPAFPGSPSTKPLTVLVAWSAHFCSSSGDPDHVDVRANMLAPFLTAIVTGATPDAPPRILGGASGTRRRSHSPRTVFRTGGWRALTLPRHWRRALQAVAVAEIDGPEAGLAILDRLDLDHYRYFHSTRADLLRRSGRHSEAHYAYRRALDLAQTEPEQRFLQDRGQ